MRIAVVSTDGETVNEHFGRASRFLIFEVSGSQQSLVEVRDVEPLSTGDRDHPFDAGRLAVFLESIGDCSRVYCTKIGERPQEALARLGIDVVPGERAIAGITA